MTNTDLIAVVGGIESDLVKLDELRAALGQ